MSIVLKVVAIVMAVVLAIGILGTAVGVGTNIARYMVKQNFDMTTAATWSWNEYIEWLKSIWPFVATAEEETIPFANQFIDVVPCINL